MLCSVSEKASGATKQEGCQSIISLVAILVLKRVGFSVFPLPQADELTVRLHYRKFRNAALCAEVKPTSRKALSIKKKASICMCIDGTYTWKEENESQIRYWIVWDGQ